MTIPQRILATPDLRIARRVVDFRQEPELPWALAPEQPAFLWSRGDDEMIVASGVAQAFEAGGADRFGEVANWLGQDQGSRPLLVGGFARGRRRIGDGHLLVQREPFGS